MAELVGRPALIAETRVRCQVSPCKVCGGQSGTGTGGFPEYLGLPPPLSFLQCFVPAFMYTLLWSEVETGEAWEP
jgi:hypothetical protein